MNKKKAIKKLSNIYVLLGFIFLILAFLFIAFPVAPYIIYRINPDLTDEEVVKISRDIATEPIVPINVDKEDNNLPEYDPNLPEQPHLLIPDIRVSSPIGESVDPEESLKEGTWMVSEYGSPDENNLPIILAAHRFGYVYWDRETRNRVSFFHLPDTGIGDRVEIIWNQRKYVYEIYAEDESTYIKDYDADLILYTCKYFNSPQRIFKYAQRVN